MQSLPYSNQIKSALIKVKKPFAPYVAQFKTSFNKFTKPLRITIIAISALFGFIIFLAIIAALLGFGGDREISIFQPPQITQNQITREQTPGKYAKDEDMVEVIKITDDFTKKFQGSLKDSTLNPPKLNFEVEF